MHPTGMAYRVNNIGLWLDEPEELLGERAAEKLGVTRSDLASVRVVRSVLDARKKGSPRYIYTLEVELAPGRSPAACRPTWWRRRPLRRCRRGEGAGARPIIIGTGPAGLFCALACWSAACAASCWSAAARWCRAARTWRS